MLNERYTAPFAVLLQQYILTHVLSGPQGALKPGQTVVEATSGNTGIALAMVSGSTKH